MIIKSSLLSIAIWLATMVAAQEYSLSDLILSQTSHEFSADYGGRTGRRFDGDGGSSRSSVYPAGNFVPYARSQGPDVEGSGNFGNWAGNMGSYGLGRRNDFGPNLGNNPDFGRGYLPSSAMGFGMEGANNFGNYGGGTMDRFGLGQRNYFGANNGNNFEFGGGYLMGTGYGTQGYGDPTMYSPEQLKACDPRLVDQSKCSTKDPDGGQQEWRFIKYLGWVKVSKYGAARRDWLEYRRTLGWPFHATYGKLLF